MKLRPYQQEAVEAIYQHLRGRDDSPCVVLPTGTGKSLVIAQLCTDVVHRWSGRVLVLAHVKELLEQNAEKIRALCPGIDLGVYSAGLNQRDTQSSVLVAGIQSVYKRAAELGAFDIVVIDEAHLIPAEGDGMYRTFLQEAKALNPLLRVVGLTATPYRLKTGLICQDANILNHICYEAGLKEMIVQGYLSPLRARSGKVKVNLDELRIQEGEFVASEVEKAMDDATLVRAACSEIIEATKDRRAVLIFASGVKHCRHVAEEIRRISGQPCGVVTGDTPATERAELLQRFKGEDVRNGLFEKQAPIKFLANVGVLTTGFDAPNVDCVVMLRPTNSPGLYVQMLGRGTRLCEGKKDCLVLDYGGNVLRHGPVDDVRIEPQSHRGDGEAPAKECPECLALIAAGYSTCPECGYSFPPPQRSKHDAKSAHAPLLSGQATTTEYAVKDTLYFVHAKRGAPPDHPKTLRVEYQIGWQQYKSEWVCIEHDGWAAQKAESWWRKRSHAPFPLTAEQAVQLAEAGALATTKAISVRSVAGEDFDRIVDYELGAIPPWREPGWEEDSSLPVVDATFGMDDETIPF